jgi:hypothetical protein
MKYIYSVFNISPGNQGFPNIFYAFYIKLTSHTWGLHNK